MISDRCERCHERLFWHAFRELPPLAALPIRLHLLFCSDCRALHRRMGGLRGTLKNALGFHSAPARFGGAPLHKGELSR